MKFGVSIWLWTSPVTLNVVEKYAGKIAGMGFDTIEIPFENPADLEPSKVRKILDKNGLEVTTCAAMGPGRDLVHPDEEVRKNTMAYLKQSVEVASEIGASLFAGPIYAEVGRLWKMTEMEREANVELFVSQLGELSDYAAAHGITVCVEALNRFETSFLNLTSQVVDVLERVNHPSCKLMFDLFHAGIEEKSLGDAIRLAGKYLHHLQVADNDRGTPGTGQFNWDEVAGALNDIGYDNQVIIETFSPDNEMLAKAASIWRPLAPTPDELASDGLDFLKKLLAGGNS